MKDEKKIYFKYGCLKAVIRIAASPEEKKIFSNIADNQELLNEWNQEYIKITYDDFLQRLPNLNKREIKSHLIEILALTTTSEENVQNIISMFDMIVKENLHITTFSRTSMSTGGIMREILTRKEDEVGQKSRFKGSGIYDGLLPYLYEHNRMKEFDALYKVIEPIYVAMDTNFYPEFLKKFKSSLSNKN